MKRERVSFNLKPETIMLIEIAANALNENKSTIVEQALNFRLKYILNEVDKLPEAEDLELMYRTKKIMNKASKEKKHEVKKS